MSTAAPFSANQANAQRSTGPVTEAGKSAPSRNNLHYGARSQSVLLPGEDPAEYEAFLAELTTHFTAVDSTELRCVHEMANADWRLRRIRRCSSDALTRRIAALSAADPDAPLADLHSLAIETLGTATGTSYSTWLRYESKFERQYNRPYQDWLHYQTNRRRVAGKQADIWMRQAIFQPLPAEPPASNPQHPAASLTELASSVQNAPGAQADPDVAHALLRAASTLMSTPSVQRPSSELASSVQNAASRAPIARNAPCPCRSGQKYKRCCGRTAPPLLSRVA